MSKPSKPCLHKKLKVVRHREGYGIRPCLHCASCSAEWGDHYRAYCYLLSRLEGRDNEIMEKIQKFTDPDDLLIYLSSGEL